MNNFYCPLALCTCLLMAFLWTPATTYSQPREQMAFTLNPSLPYANGKLTDTITPDSLRCEPVTKQGQLIHSFDAVQTITHKRISQNIPASQTSEDIIVLDFEGLGNTEQVLDYYNGGYSGGGHGPGPDYGVTFSGSTLSIIAGYAGGSGNFQNEPSPVTVMFFLDEDNAIMNMESGFQNGFSFYYSSIDHLGRVEVYDEHLANGNLLASLEMDPLGTLDIPGGAYNIWEPVGVTFEGVAKSIKFIGTANKIGFDDITFGSDIPGGSESPPRVTTLEATEITASSAIIGGEVTSDGGLEITDRGVYWGTEPNAANTGTPLFADPGTGMFLLELESLSPNTTYYYAAYAVNDEGTGFGEEKEFTTLAEPPTVVSLEASDITYSSAIIGGEVTFDGGADVFERGFYFSDTPDPQSTGAKIYEGSGTGQFSSSITNLIPATTYYYVAFGTNMVGTEYGSDESFVTAEESVFVPNAIMPSSHIEENRVFIPTFDVNPDIYSLEIFNQWGERIFSSNDATIGWDGSLQNSKAVQGTYIYRISFVDLRGEKREMHGPFMLIR